MRGGPRSFTRDSSCLALLWILPCRFAFHLRGSHPLRPVFPDQFRYAIRSLVQSLPRGARAPVWAPPVSLAATTGIDVSFFSSGYLDVSVHRVPPVPLWIHGTVTEGSSAGSPHSDVCGSRPICGSPQLFAAYRVFLRLSVPRHPPCALSRLTFLSRLAWRYSGPFCFFHFSMSYLVCTDSDILLCFSSIRFSRYNRTPSEFILSSFGTLSGGSLRQWA